MLQRVVTMLSRDFRVVGAVSDGAQLVEAEAALHPDVLVVDVCMPVMTGLEAAACIRQRGSQVPFVCLTAYGEADVVEASVHAGALGFVHKPRLVQDLVPAVRAALEGRSYISELQAESTPNHN